MGTIVVELYWHHAPKTCANFAELARRGYYNSTKFHRIIKDFMVQGGDPTGTGRYQIYVKVIEVQAFILYFIVLCFNSLSHLTHFIYLIALDIHLNNNCKIKHIYSILKQTFLPCKMFYASRYLTCGQLEKVNAYLILCRTWWCLDLWQTV